MPPGVPRMVGSQRLGDGGEERVAALPIAVILHGAQSLCTCPNTN